MSEVNDAVQIVLVIGRSAYLLENITVKAALTIGKLLQTIYLAKWKGATSLSRFRNIKGDDFSFINVGSEDRFLLDKIENELEAHGILCARLPDLCGGDGRTQYVISPSDAAKFKAFLLDHSVGKYKDIKVGTISAADYARTGVDKNDQPTPEYAALTRSAQAALPELKEKTPRMKKSLSDDRITERSQASEFQSPQVIGAIRIHDANVRQEATGKGVVWINQSPIVSQTKWCMYQMPDGLYTVMIPKDDIQTADGKKRAAIYTDKRYPVINMKDGSSELLSGKKVADAFGKPGLKEVNTELKNTLRNKGEHKMDVSIEFPNRAKKRKGAMK